MPIVIQGQEVHQGNRFAGCVKYRLGKRGWRVMYKRDGKWVELDRRG